MLHEDVPKLRFKEFNNKWLENKIGNVIKISAGGDIDKSKLKKNGKFPVVANSLTNKGIVGYYDDYKIEAPAVTVTGRGDVGHATARHINFTPIVRLLSLESKEFDIDFLENAINSMKILNESTGVPQLTAPQLGSYKILYPNISEQSAIGAFFQTLDELLSAYKDNLANYQAFKATMLSKMFPKAGQTTPEIRLDGFDGEWEEKKLGDVADIIGGGTPSTGNKKYWNGDIDWYSPVEIGATIYVENSQKKITTLGLQKSSAKILPVGTILYTSRAGIGNTAILAKEACTNQGFQSIVPHKGKLDTYFIYSRSKELKKYGERNGAGSTFIEISGKEFAKMPLSLPPFPEQHAIGAFFANLDDLIASQQAKITELETLKKKLLQDMFV